MELKRAQAVEGIRAATVGRHCRDSNAGSVTCSRLKSKVTAMLAPQPAEQCQGLIPCPHGYESDSLLLRHSGDSCGTDLEDLSILSPSR